jgi:hypothetical protein
VLLPGETAPGNPRSSGRSPTNSLQPSPTASSNCGASSPKPWNSAGEPLFTRLAYESPADYAETLEDAVVVMRRRKVAAGR